MLTEKVSGFGWFRYVLLLAVLVGSLGLSACCLDDGEYCSDDSDCCSDYCDYDYDADDDICQ